MLKRGSLSFAAGFVTAALLFGGVAAGSSLTQQITVSFRPLTYVFDGIERKPPADQQGFIYKDRTYVPLRFMGEALGEAVAFDQATGTIYVGSRPGELPEIWKDQTQQGDGTFVLKHFPDGFKSLRGANMPEATLVSVATLPTDDKEKAGTTSQLWADYEVPEGAKRLTGTLFVPERYFGIEAERRIGRLVVLNELNRAIYTSPDITTSSPQTPFDVPLAGAKKIRIAVTLYPYEGTPVNDKLVMAQLGISELTLQYTEKAEVK